MKYLKVIIILSILFTLIIMFINSMFINTNNMECTKTGVTFTDGFTNFKTPIMDCKEK